MRTFIIDTDATSDDAVALIMALREKSIKIEAITVVAGAVPIELAVKNALLSVEMANTYKPLVYKGMKKPLFRKLFTAEFVHGEDGMGNMNLPEPKIKIQEMHAIDAIINLVMNNPGKMEIITLGPLTNLAMAVLKEPLISKRVKNVTAMAGTGLGPGNITPVSEFNIYVDAEAASIVLKSGMPITFVGWDVCMGKCYLNEKDLQYLSDQNSKIADFCLRCNKSLIDFNLKRLDRKGLDLPDPTAVAAAIWPDIIISQFDAYTYIETNSELTYGQLVIDRLNLLDKEPNAKICVELDSKKFRSLLFEHII